MKASYNLFPVSNPDTKENLSRTINFEKSTGYWTVPGTSGNLTMIGDQAWFYAGKNDQSPNDNCIIGIGNIIDLIQPNTSLHQAMTVPWVGDYSDRAIIILELLPLLPKDKMTYDELVALFRKNPNAKVMANGSLRVKF
jgi:hypothetical protein